MHTSHKYRIRSHKYRIREAQRQHREDLLVSELQNEDNTKEQHEILVKHGTQIS